ncbi:outer membrane protein [Cognatiyoonia sp. IB215182]|uniref:outer membrane protein n=1 Tax=Cognatiyoonia sp. IB215182 TaxID=3097353 RepID=UPI002A0C0F30|nr:outer membrane beta-barrel protein [Cognatiyoonia sp. IB215182]MDX8350773.1 outer membrane beta-barrel protein [Cognatiyoonia sp. IB215182]
MIKSPVSIVVFVAATAAAQSALAQGFGDTWYVSAFGGYSNIGSIDTNFAADKVEHEFDDSYALGITVGKTVAPNLRAELELSYSSYDGGNVTYDLSGFDFTTEGDADLTFLLANVWYDLPSVDLGGGAVPYVGAGIGAVRLHTDTFFNGFGSGYSDTVTATAFQIGLGVQLPINTGMLDIGYRFKAAQGFDIDNVAIGFGRFDDGDFNSNNLQVSYAIKS